MQPPPPHHHLAAVSRKRPWKDISRAALIPACEMVPAHVWARAAEWCSLREVLLLAACSQQWLAICEGQLIPQSLRQRFGARAVSTISASSKRHRSWARLAGDALCFDTPAARNGRPRAVHRLHCGDLLARARQAFWADGVDFDDELAQDRFCNVTVLNNLRIDPNSLTDELYFEFFVGLNSNGNLLVGLMTEKLPEAKENLPGVPEGSGVVGAQPGAMEVDAACDRSSAPALRRPLTFAVCANTGELYVEGKRFTTTRKGALAVERPALDDHPSPLVVGVQISRHSAHRCVRVAFFVQRVHDRAGALAQPSPIGADAGGSEEVTPGVACEMTMPRIVTAVRSDECLRLGVEMCTQFSDHGDWVVARGPRPTPPRPTYFHVAMNVPC